ncbi:hypothetical protein J6590_075062 [Homalodisca vitripennis]|nr:hypothetical protein J6590_075062 [Homalodisca vitripennis]
MLSADPLTHRVLSQLVQCCLSSAHSAPNSYLPAASAPEELMHLNLGLRLRLLTERALSPTLPQHPHISTPHVPSLPYESSKYSPC